MAADVRKTMIECAAGLLAEKGLQATSLSEVLEASGAPRGSLYHHFPGGKEELVLAAVALIGEQMRQILDSFAGRPAGEVARGFGQVWRTILERSDFAAGCGVVAVTIAADSPTLRERVGTVFQSSNTNLAWWLAEGGVPEARAAALAATLIAAFEGAVVLARAQKSFEPFDLVAAELYATVDKATVKRRRKRASAKS